MKKNLKTILLVAILIVLAIDVYGVWKYKLSETKTAYSEDVVNDDAITVDITNQNLFDDTNIEYAELTNKDFFADEKLFLIDVKSTNDENQYTIKGLIYEEYSITAQEYNALRNGNGSIEIFGISYYKDKLQSGNLMLTSDNEMAENFYIKYNAKTNKYIVKDSTSDYSIYKASDRYVEKIVDGDLPFVIQKNNKTEKLTVADVTNMHNKIIPPTNQVKINYCTIDFSRQGDILKITELIF